jgi:hypothetical protein
MLTPHLEKLILCGKASYNTFVFGGSEKSILNITNDRYIIITDITIFHHLDNLKIELTNEELNNQVGSKMLTQLCVFSDRSFNHFIIRNEYDITEKGNNFHVIPKGHTKFDTYLIHDRSIAFNWILSTKMTNFPGDTEATSVGRPKPFDYGKQGQPVQSVVLVSDLATIIPWKINHAGESYPLINQVQTNQLQYPVDRNTTPNFLTQTFQFPIANISYVEVFEPLTNISATL